MHELHLIDLVNLLVLGYLIVIVEVADTGGYDTKLPPNSLIPF
jgi:hypothetical protein